MCPSAGENECKWLLAGNNVATLGTSGVKPSEERLMCGCGTWVWLNVNNASQLYSIHGLWSCWCLNLPFCAHMCNLATPYMQYTCVWLHCGMLCTGDSAVVLSTTWSTYVHMPYCWSMLRVEPVFQSCRGCSFDNRMYFPCWHGNKHCKTKLG